MKFFAWGNRVGIASLCTHNIPVQSFTESTLMPGCVCTVLIFYMASNT